MSSPGLKPSDPVFTSRVRHVECRGLRFAYFEAGDGPLALLLHGFPDTPHSWSPLAAALVGRGYRVVAPFTRGYAPTEAPKARKITLEELAEDALALIDAFGGRASVLVGHDWGAATAYLATAMDPTRIERLVTIAIPHPATVKPSLKLLWIGRHFITLRLPWALASVRRNEFRMIDVLYRRWSPTWAFGPEETAAVKASFAEPASLDAAIGYYRGVKLSPTPALRGQIAVPTLAVAGTDDPAVGVAAYHAAARKFAGDYRVLELPGGHFVHRECPDRFRDGVLEFLAAR